MTITKQKRIKYFQEFTNQFSKSGFIRIMHSNHSYKFVHSITFSSRKIYLMKHEIGSMVIEAQIHQMICLLNRDAFQSMSPNCH